MVITVLIISISLQLIAAVAALRLIKLTHRLWAWLIISSALLLMVIRRSLTLYLHLLRPEEIVFSLEAELVALVTSLLLLVGIFLFYPILLSFRRESENIYEQLIDAAPDTFAFLLNREGEILAINKQGKMWLQNDIETNENELCSKLQIKLSKIMDQSIAAFFKSLVESKANWHHEVSYAEKWYDISFTSLTNRAGKVDKLALFVSDISNIKVSHERLIEHEQSLMQADKLASIGIMVSGIAHEINNPNQFILSNITSIEKFTAASIPILNRYHEEFGTFRLGGLPYERAKTVMPQMITDIRQGAERIQRILSELRSFTMKNKKSSHRPVDMGKVVESALVLVRSLTKKATREFIVSLEPGVPLIQGDFQQLEQVVVNLVTNACQALTNPNENILLSVTYDNKRVYLIVDDSGSGISEENLSRITDPFFSTKKKTGGTGLGLAVTKRIVEEHCGDMEFDSQPDAGTRVTISLPLESSHIGR